ncbi:glycoside hydrolase family 43 protein [Colletotrichum gloeosporioides 23]|nr:glycoside hydrolase family 43 protein [Colletotrichum gloeosporioides 23]
MNLFAINFLLCLLTAAYAASNIPSTPNLTTLRSSLTYEAYLFVYFVRNSIGGENIFLAASSPGDILAYTPLNASAPILTSSKGTHGLRDPFITRAPAGDKFFLLATDLSIGRGMSFTDAQRVGSRHIEVWESPDLVHWSEQRHVLVAPPEAGNAWAPEAYFDEGSGMWSVFWTSSLYEEDDVEHTGRSYNRILYATTSDFVEFSEARVWQDSGGPRYDSTVVEVDGVYHRFTKDDSGNATGCRDLIHEKSSNLSAGLDGWDVVASCISTTAGVGEIEGPAVAKSTPGDVNGEKYFLFVDEFTGRRYIPLVTEDISKPGWKLAGSGWVMPPSARHGGVMPITAAEREALLEAYQPGE